MCSVAIVKVEGAFSWDFLFLDGNRNYRCGGSWPVGGWRCFYISFRDPKSRARMIYIHTKNARTSRELMRVEPDYTIPNPFKKLNGVDSRNSPVIGPFAEEF